MAKLTTVINGCALSISGKLLKVVKVRDEPYDCVTDPSGVISALKVHRPRVDIFSFVQEITETEPRYPYKFNPVSFAVLPITTYEYWWTKQINDKTRNLVRKAQKSHIKLRTALLDDELVNGIKGIYDESSVRQGKGFTHFQKPSKTIMQELSTFPERSTFIGAYAQDELIGFAKLVQGEGVVSLMHIISKISERSKAPTNALVSKAVEICAERGIGLLHYGVWSLGGLGMFKTNHAFEKREIPRYFIPLTVRGHLALKLGMHQSARERIPEQWREHLIVLRTRFKTWQSTSGWKRVMDARRRSL